jgi:hypothetical protein
MEKKIKIGKGKKKNEAMNNNNTDGVGGCPKGLRSKLISNLVLTIQSPSKLK